MKLITTLFLALAVAGCATTANYEKILDTWVGSDELSLVRKWGPPKRTYEIAGSKFLVFSDARSLHLPGIAPTYTTTFSGNTAYTNSIGGVAAQDVDLSCQTTFEVVNGRIASWRWQGNDCTATK